MPDFQDRMRDADPARDLPPAGPEQRERILAAATGRRWEPWPRVLAAAAALAIVVGGGLAALNMFGPPPTAAPAEPSTPDASPTPDRPEPGPTSPTVGGPGELAGEVMLMLNGPGEIPEMCAAWGASLPPYCHGPRVLGDVDWDALDAESAGGKRWAHVWLVGTFDTDGDLHLTRAPSLDRPEGAQEPTEPADVEFPELCTDPLRGADLSGTHDEAALRQRAEALPGYVDGYVSNGSDFYNIRVSGDPEVAHAALREVWQGELCVVGSERPTRAAVQSAQEALADDPLIMRTMVSSSGSGGDAALEVQLWRVSPEIVDALHEAVAPHLAPDDVQVTAVFNPLG